MKLVKRIRKVKMIFKEFLEYVHALLKLHFRGIEVKLAVFTHCKGIYNQPLKIKIKN